MSDFCFPFVCGFVVAFLLVSFAVGSTWDDRIKAGLFERSGVAYRIEKAQP